MFYEMGFKALGLCLRDPMLGSQHWTLYICLCGGQDINYDLMNYHDYCPTEIAQGDECLRHASLSFRYPDVLMMQSGQDWNIDNDTGPFDCAMQGCIFNTVHASQECASYFKRA
jgi:hypothetical protein